MQSNRPAKDNLARENTSLAIFKQLNLKPHISAEDKVADSITVNNQKTFKITEKILATDVANFISQFNELSDHLPITSSDAVTFSWNMLQRCHGFQNKKTLAIEGYNNAFGKVEDEKEYISRRDQTLNSLGRIIETYNTANHQLPIQVICLQELQAEDNEIQRCLTQGLQVARLNEKNNSLSLKYKSDNCHLVMLHTDKVKPIELCDLTSLQLDNTNRYQAVRFLDIKTQCELVVVNIHQDFSSVSISPAPGLKNLKLLQAYFTRIPCIITGDFNTDNLVLNEEGGHVIHGMNTNLIWDVKEQKVKTELGSCDHIIMNEKYCEQLLPKLQAAEREQSFDPVKNLNLYSRT